MCEFHTSVALRLSLTWVVVAACLCVAAGFFVGYESRGASPGPPGPASGSSVLSVSAAGTLGTVFPSLAALLANESPGVTAPMAAQQYQGSLAALRSISELHQFFDVAAAADFRLVPHLLSPDYASWEVAFASSPEALAYDPSAVALQGINSTNWAAEIQRPGVLLGVANASTDPNGYNGIFVLQLEGLLLNGSLPAVYSHFYSGAPGGFAVPNPASTREEPEAQAATLLSQHVVQAFIIYRSYAIAHHLAYVELDPAVNLGGFESTYLSTYARASTEILDPSGSLTPVRGAPVAFCATVPLNAPNATLGELFVHLLVSVQGSAILQSFGFQPLLPGYSFVMAGSLPPSLAPQTTPLPSPLVAEI
jgi:molybdate/tungstate transport system substrate-binding protein